DAALHLLAAGKRRLLPRRDRILVGSRRREGKIDPSLAPRVQRQLLQESPRTVRSTMRKHVVERVQPLPRFQDFDSVRLYRLLLSLLRLSHVEPPHGRIAMFHHKELRGILLEGV